MNVVEMNIGDIFPYENNPRKNESAVEPVANSIKEFGWQQPIVVDKDNVIIVGHTRWEAAQRLGLKKVPVLVADNLTEEQAKAYRLADNKTNEISGWDFTALDEEMEELKNIDMTQFGFDELEDYNIDDLFGEAPEKEKSEGTDHIITCPYCGKEIAIDDHYKVYER